jgi:hypothetical protein
MLEIVPATTETHYRLVRELLTQQVAWDTAETARLGLNAQGCLDFYFASGETVLPGAYGAGQWRATGGRSLVKAKMRRAKTKCPQLEPSPIPRPTASPKRFAIVRKLL